MIDIQKLNNYRSQKSLRKQPLIKKDKYSYIETNATITNPKPETKTWQIFPQPEETILKEQNKHTAKKDASPENNWNIVTPSKLLQNTQIK